KLLTEEGKIPIDPHLVLGNLAFFRQQLGRVDAVLTIAPIAIDHDSLRVLAQRQNGSNILLQVKIIELVSPRYMAGLVMFRVAGIQKNDQILRATRIMK